MTDHRNLTQENSLIVSYWMLTFRSFECAKLIDFHFGLMPQRVGQSEDGLYPA